MQTNNSIPWMEKYRPTQFENIVLDEFNKKILQNIIQKSHFPNLLFYGPPGTGKTTTIINLINSYQQKLHQKNRDLVIHLNASDERGIDIIRNQINQFVNSKPLFHNGMKFVILDEVDYMTKNAQQALRYLLQNYSSSVRFCLICNYISKIDESLQNEFIRLRFNQLPKNEIITFLNHISVSEKLNLTTKSISCIQKLYKSDIRSMINFMQSNQDIVKKNYINSQVNVIEENDFNTNANANEENFNIIDNDVWKTLYEKLLKRENIKNIISFIHTISSQYNIDKKNIIKDFLNYIIRTHQNILNEKFLIFVENLMHSQNLNNNIHIHYSITRLFSFVSL